MIVQKSHIHNLQTKNDLIKIHFQYDMKLQMEQAWLGHANLYLIPSALRILS